MVWERKSNSKGSHPWGNQPDIIDSDIDLRREIALCLENHGHEVFLRSKTDQRCACYKADDPFKEYDITCASCQGFGWVYVDTKQRGYRRPAFGTFGFTGASLRIDIGSMGAADTVWYFPHTSDPVVGNFIVEVTTDDLGRADKPYNIERIHEVKQAHLARERKGRPEFWEVLARERQLGK